ncbi:aminoglycoside 3'-phosphotransferase [Microbacterium sp. ET2]|uniref:aminoglycoside 3'-phosphotransferase n=1 Tax=Microbacterium albipurpureum TaxID=3050384 RepID=UPI00259CF8CB|nr:aminoglycoside 3'-phosphotransferase [Microbacterium sp. ET2 (Ac-2212)]WJL96812.1 aminoglycoside 3'-phosphotransferase [Microbacterium sp. ET2 (Ac-2212)]
MSIPVDGVVVPGRVRRLAGGDDLIPVWRNELGGLTFRANGAGGIRYVKWGPRNAETTVEGEAERLAWATRFTAVPRVIARGGDDDEEWLVTEALPGESAVAPRWIAAPEVAVTAIGVGLRSFHDRLPVPECPFSWRVTDRFEKAARRGIQLPEALRDAPSEDDLVVCHGDACAPNTVLADDGNVSGHVDLGALGVADRWADLAVAAMSLEWNYGPGWTETFLDAYGVAGDEDRMSYYQELWNAT